MFVCVKEKPIFLPSSSLNRFIYPSRRSVQIPELLATWYPRRTNKYKKMPILYQANMKATVYRNGGDGVKEKEVEVVVKTEKLNSASIDTWLTCSQLFISSIYDLSQKKRNQP